MCTSASEAQQERARDAKPPVQRPLFVFDKLVPELRRKSNIPPRPPAFLPGVTRKDPIYAILESADNFGYEILLAHDLSCQGENGCLYGSVEAGVSPFNRDGRQGIPLELDRGIKAEFIETICHAYCNESYIQWQEGRFYYSIGIKGEKQAFLTRAANSAIATGLGEARPSKAPK